ncbi:hypothetical protein HMPREF1544_10132 [Mucor circinelloides 1006PhL]|uniref:Uncharacterized protein n=1 Tax=Mucor circinelloides f. circinelloides (strain 1006PhL) TaxID=1220926 RepID=S2J4T5_MUCC1|nr:hypothetical protein HMPREF1544_10132 [Mucor circinelloides 1006PhL]
MARPSSTRQPASKRPRNDDVDNGNSSDEDILDEEEQSQQELQLHVFLSALKSIINVGDIQAILRQQNELMHTQQELMRTQNAILNKVSLMETSLVTVINKVNSLSASATNKDVAPDNADVVDADQEVINNNMVSTWIREGLQANSSAWDFSDCRKGGVYGEHNAHIIADVTQYVLDEITHEISSRGGGADVKRSWALFNKSRIRSKICRKYANDKRSASVVLQDKAMKDKLNRRKSRRVLKMEKRSLFVEENIRVKETLIASHGEGCLRLLLSNELQSDEESDEDNVGADWKVYQPAYRAENPKTKLFFEDIKARLAEMQQAPLAKNAHRRTDDFSRFSAVTLTKSTIGLLNESNLLESDYVFSQ